MKICLIILTTLLSVDAQYLHDGYIYDRPPPFFQKLGPQSTTPQPVNYEYFPPAIPNNQYLPPSQVSNGYHYPPPKPIDNSYLPPNNQYLPPPEFKGYHYPPPTTPKFAGYVYTRPPVYGPPEYGPPKKDECFLTPEEEFKKWKGIYNKRYTSVQEEKERLARYVKNAMDINEHNEKFRRKEVDFELEKNEFTDMDYEEVISTRTGFIPDERICEKPLEHKNKQNIPFNVTFDASEEPRRTELCDVKVINDDGVYEMNWVTNGSVTPVKNQKTCGSCWAFAATGVIEAHHKRMTGTLSSFSEQNLIDCVPPPNRNGCMGGSMTKAFDYILNNNGINLERVYKYEPNPTNRYHCRFKESNAQGKINEPVEVNKGNEDKLIRRHRRDLQDIKRGREEALEKILKEVGPIAVAIYLTDRAAIQYKSGVFTDIGCTQRTPPNHAVLLVGYGTSPRGGDFWLIKNSWGPEWGENGYMRIARGLDNHCDIATFASYAL